MTPTVQNADSLESIHDAIHSIVGSNGHMTYLDYSAFDPAFFLHHAMIDRCFALWQALYPDSYVEPMQAVEQTFTIRVGDWKDETSGEHASISNRYSSANARQHLSLSSWTSNATTGLQRPCAPQIHLATPIQSSWAVGTSRPSRVRSTSFTAAVSEALVCLSDYCQTWTPGLAEWWEVLQAKSTEEGIASTWQTFSHRNSQ